MNSIEYKIQELVKTIGSKMMTDLEEGVISIFKDLRQGNILQLDVGGVTEGFKTNKKILCQLPESMLAK